MANRKKPQMTQINADGNPELKNICVYLRYLRFCCDCDGPISAPWKGHL